MKAHWEWEFAAPRERLWRYVADSDWVNRHAGLPKISFRYEPQTHGGSRAFAWFRRGPFFVEWEERPTLWRSPEFYEVERRYTRGPLRSFTSRTELHALDDARTRVSVDVDLQPRHALLTPFLPLLAAQGKAGADRAFALAAELASHGSTHHAAPTQQRLRQLLEAGVDAQVVATLESFLEASDQRELGRIRPYDVADRYDLSRRETLRAFLTGTRRGLFNLSWDVMCPSCRGPANGFETLRALKNGLHCDACNLSYDAAFDRSVEVTFNARPLGLSGDAPVFCIASPRRSPHVYAQTALQPGMRETIEVVLEPGVYDINAVGVAIAPFAASAEAREHQVAAHLVPPKSIEVPHEVGAGRVRIVLENALDHDALVRIEEGRWPDTIATAAAVTALQEFRDLFSSEVLAPGLELSIESIAVLFTDLVGSTAMYSRAGDAPAFKLVTDHFERMRHVIDEHEGAIVKTIGDAVMAVFTDPLKCFDAALRLDSSVSDILHEGVPLRLRVGFHVGPCIAMRANEKIDYFGTTVNLAARLQGLAHAGDVTLASNIAQRPEIAARIAHLRLRKQTEQLPIKGFAREIDVVRVSAPT